MGGVGARSPYDGVAWSVVDRTHPLEHSPEGSSTLKEGEDDELEDNEEVQYQDADEYYV